jgi:hypothetical protein
VEVNRYSVVVYKGGRRGGLSPVMLCRACRRDEDDDVFIVKKK